MSDLFYQYEIVNGDRHRIVWLDERGLEAAKADGWGVLKAYLNTGLVRNESGRLVQPR